MMGRLIRETGRASVRWGCVSCGQVIDVHWNASITLQHRGWQPGPGGNIPGAVRVSRDYLPLTPFGHRNISFPYPSYRTLSQAVNSFPEPVVDRLN